MNLHYVVSLCSITSKMDFENFKIKSNSLLQKTLDSWVEEPLMEAENNTALNTDFIPYFKKLSIFREKISFIILKNCNFELKILDDTPKYIMYFDIDKIVLEFHGSLDKSKFEDIVQIVEELTVKFKSFNYIENFNFLIEHNCSTLPEERKEWSEVVKSMFKEKNYIPID